jgi:putative nucleotidyltransferase with HDIG domain
LNIYLLVPLAEVIFCLALLIVLTISGRRHIARRPFSIFLFFMMLWGFLIFMMRASIDMAIALVWEKFAFWAILTASLFFYRFTIAVTGARPNKYFMYPLYFTYFVVLGLIPTGLVVSGMQMMWYGKAPIIGSFFPLYVLCACLPVIYSAVLIIRHHKHARVIDDRIRDQYLIAGIAVMIIGATTDYLPALGINIYPLGVFGNISFCLIASAAMLRHNLLDMKVVLRKGVTYSLTTILIFGVFGSLVYLLSFFFQDFMSPGAITITIVTVFIAASLFQPVLSRLQHTVDRWFFRERYNHIQNLKEFTQKTKVELDLEQLASSLVDTVAAGMQCQGVYLLLPSPASGHFITYAYSGGENQGEPHFSASSPLVMAMKQRDGIVDYNEIDTIPSFVSLPSHDRKNLENSGIELLVPLRSDSHLAGMLLLGKKISHEPYSLEERRLLQEVSTDVAVHIDNANHFENMKRKHSELQKAMVGVTHAVSILVSSRDPYTAGHQRRVAELARAIAKEIGLSEWQTTGVYIAGLLHDVGKVSVPSEILSKPGKITTSEFDIIKTHCRVGYDILRRIDFPWPVTRAILQHHERLDGSGYPDGLTGDDIVLEARIFGVADVVEAMSSHRPYRPALGLESALAEIRRGSGILYDSDVVEACLRLLKKNEPEFDRIMAAAETSQELVLEVIKERW